MDAIKSTRPAAHRTRSVHAVHVLYAYSIGLYDGDPFNGRRPDVK